MAKPTVAPLNAVAARVLAAPQPLPRTLEHFQRVNARCLALRETVARMLRTRAFEQREVTLEFGCGHGHFLVAYAAAHPDAACIGVDYCSERIRRATRKQAHAALPNLGFVRGEANEFIAALPAETRVARIFVLFPDPWPKRRHHKHRLVSAEFLARLAPHAMAGCEFCFRTDSFEYFAETEQLFAARADWQLAPQRPWPFEHTTVFQERTEARFSLIAVSRG